MARQREGYIQKLTDGSLWARVTYTGSDGKRHTLRRKVKNRTEGKKLLRELIDGLDRVGDHAVEGDRMRFRDLAQRYEAERLIEARYHNDRKVAGLRSWKVPRVYIRVLAAYFGNQFIKSITHADIERFKSHRLLTPVRCGTDAKTGEPTCRPRAIAAVNRELELMRAVMRYAQRQGWIYRSPFEMGSPLISKADETRRERTLSHDEEALLLAACAGRRAHLRPLLIAALDTGMRRGELLKLEWRDVDLAGAIIIVRAMNSKTARARIVPMTPRLRAELGALWQKSALDMSARIFGITDTVKNSFASACRAAGIDGFRFHDCRHTAITRMIAAGVPAEEVMKISGHTQTSTFLRYLNPTGYSLNRAAELLSSFNADRSESKPDATSFIN